MLHGAERDNSFIVHDNAGVELGQGRLQILGNRAPTLDNPLQIRMYLDAHPAARDMLYGALTARAKFLQRQRRAGPARLVAECDPNNVEMRGYYAKAGFDDTDGEELFHWDLRADQRPFYAPVGTTITQIQLQNYADMGALLTRVNYWGVQQHEIEWLLEAADLPYFAAYGVYSGHECVGEVMATGAEGEAVLEMLYTLPEWRRRHVATALMLHLREVLARRGATTLRVQSQRSNRASIRLLERLQFQWMHTLLIYPSMNL
jgi:ribosomal protein S18 acetylase RimI-like enzyme